MLAIGMDGIGFSSESSISEGRSRSRSRSRRTSSTTSSIHVVEKENAHWHF